MWPTSRAKCLPDPQQQQHTHLWGFALFDFQKREHPQCRRISLIENPSSAFIMLCMSLWHAMLCPRLGAEWIGRISLGGFLWDRFLWQVYILRPKHRANCRSGRPVIKIGPKGALGSHEIRPIHSAPSLGQSIECGKIVFAALDIRANSSLIILFTAFKIMLFEYEPCFRLYLILVYYNISKLVL